MSICDNLKTVNENHLCNEKIPLIQVTQHAALFQRGVTISQITKDHY